METAAIRLKQLRESARVKLSVRRAAEGAGMPASSYSSYEDEKRFKKRFIPVELAHALVPVFTAHGIDRADVLGLAGIGDQGELLAPGPTPQLQLVTMQVALPSEAALARMFEGLLRPLPVERGMEPAELAQILAQRLPIGLAQLRDLLPLSATAEGREGDEVAPAPSTYGHGSRREPST